MFLLGSEDVEVDADAKSGVDAEILTDFGNGVGFPIFTDGLEKSFPVL